MSKAQECFLTGTRRRSDAGSAKSAPTGSRRRSSLPNLMSDFDAWWAAPVPSPGVKSSAA